MHQECLLVLEHTAAFSISSPLYDYKSELIEFTDSARAYNQLGLSCKAMSVLDVCWAFFDYGKAIVEGIAAGALDVAQGIIDHPFQTALCVVAGEYVLAYHVSKMLVEVAQIGLISYIDPQAGSDRWNDYIEPLTQTINAIANQELTVRNCLKTAAYCAASCFTQHKVLCVSGNLYQKAKNRVLEFVKNNPFLTPADYAAIPEGLIIKSAQKSCFTSSNKQPNELLNKQAKDIKSHINKDIKATMPAKEIQWTSHGYKHFPQKNLTWKEIVEYTKHGKAKYKPGIDIERIERYAWEHWTAIAIKDWKVIKFDNVIGAKSGLETSCIRVEISADTIHGHPITLAEYKGYLR